MDNLMVLLVVFGLLLGLSVSAGVAIFFFQRYRNPEPSLLQKRLMSFRERGREESLHARNEEMGKLARLYKDDPYKYPNLARKLEAHPQFIHLKRLMSQAGSQVPVDLFLLRNLLLPLLVSLFLMLLFPPLLLVGMMVAGASYMGLVLQKKKRFSRFVTQMPDSLNLICTSLRAGHSFQAALSIVSSEMPQPMAEEMGKVVKDTNLGLPVKEALDRLALSMDNLPDVRMFITAVLIQRESGGNLAEVLDKLSYTIRERFKLKGQVSALTGQARLTGYVLGLAPVVLLGGLSLVFYSYVQPLYETPLGQVLLVLALIMQALGFFVMKRIVDIRV